MTDCSLLSSRVCLRVQGDDARMFLNGLLTIDTVKIPAGVLRYGLLLSPQGKFLHEMFVLAEAEDSLLLDIDGARRADLLARLSLYRLRARVEIASLENMHVFAAATPTGNDAGVRWHADPRLASMGVRAYATQAPDGFATLPEAEYDARRVALGIPQGGLDMAVDRALPLEWGMDVLHAVDFEKGCYVGQEVTARTKFRAQLRKCVHKVDAMGAMLPPPGTPIMQGEQNVGEMRSSHGSAGLALISREAAIKAQREGAPLMAENLLLQACLPAWLAGDPRFATPESAG